MSRENATSKGRRYLSEGRLVVERVGPEGVAATCRGNGALYRLGWDRGAWWCDLSCTVRRLRPPAGAAPVTAPDLDDGGWGTDPSTQRRSQMPLAPDLCEPKSARTGRPS